MINDRKIEDPNILGALNDISRVLERRGLAGAVMVVGEDEAAFRYKLTAPWSGFRPDPSVPLGFRLRIVEKELGRALAQKRAEGAAHTVCQLADFGQQTQDWMEQLKLALRQHGLEFDHTPFGGQPLVSVTLGKPE
jgi:hypothetical protein